jgi:predicted SprT family Zn-dependent metalloprotease
MTDPKLLDSGQVTEDAFTEYWWKFKCDCGKEIYESSSFSVIGRGNKIHCDVCGNDYILMKTYVGGDEKRP